MLKQKKKYGMSTYLIASAIAFGFHYGFWYVVNPVIFYKGGFHGKPRFWNLFTAQHLLVEQ